MPRLADAEALVADGIEHRDGTVGDLDLDRRVVRVDGADGRTAALPYDALVWAIGLAPWRPPVPGIELAHDPQTASGMLALHEALADGPQRVAVLGAGLVGCETAGTLARLGHAVELVDRARRPLDRIGGEVAAVVASTLRLAGVGLHLGAPIVRIERCGSGHAVHVGDAVLEVDLVVCAAGATSTLPPALADDRGVARVDGRLAVPGHPDVHVIGDLAEFEHPRHGRIRIPHWDHAKASGAHAAQAILGEALPPYARDPYWFSDIAGLRIQVVGHLTAATRLVEDGDLLVGAGRDGHPVAVVLLDAPARLRDARALLATV